GMSLHTRREFTKLALAALPAAGLISAAGRALAADKPNSKFNGVQIGMNVPYSFGGKTMNGDEILENCVKLGLSAVELRAQPVELFLGVKPELISTEKGAKPVPNKDEQLRDWRKSAPMGKVKEFRSKWENAGVLIEIVKVDNIFKFSDEEIDY